jgi:hypothetical protein
MIPLNKVKGPIDFARPWAFVFITYHSASDQPEVLRRLNNIPEVKEYYSVSGQYDIVAKVQGNTCEKLTNVLMTKIRWIPNIITRLTAPQYGFKHGSHATLNGFCRNDDGFDYLKPKDEEWWNKGVNFGALKELFPDMTIPDPKESSGRKEIEHSNTF